MANTTEQPANRLLSNDIERIINPEAQRRQYRRDQWVDAGGLALLAVLCAIPFSPIALWVLGYRTVAIALLAMLLGGGVALAWYGLLVLRRQDTRGE
jgi:hypothetical protein